MAALENICDFFLTSEKDDNRKETCQENNRGAPPIGTSNPKVYS